MKLSKRLAAVAGLVRPCRMAADVGTDHAYLPVWLIENGVCESAIAADIHEGPLERAGRNIRENGCADRIRTVLTDGLCGLEKFAPDAIIIAGMGGELIARIISDAPWVRNPEIHLVLQPMTKSEILRKALWDSGFSIEEERLVREDKLYELLRVRWDGRAHPYLGAELLVGRPEHAFPSEEWAELAEKKAGYLRRRIEGLKQSGREAPEEEALLCELERLAEKKK